jgi:hypothetical protein
VLCPPLELFLPSSIRFLIAELMELVVFLVVA